MSSFLFTSLFEQSFILHSLFNSYHGIKWFININLLFRIQLAPIQFDSIDLTLAMFVFTLLYRLPCTCWSCSLYFLERYCLHFFIFSSFLFSPIFLPSIIIGLLLFDPFVSYLSYFYYFIIFIISSTITSLYSYLSYVLYKPSSRVFPLLLFTPRTSRLFS